MSVSAARGDYFDRARAIAAALLLATGAAAVIGAALDWVTITDAPSLVEGADFGDREVEKPNIRPFSGLEAGDGWWVLGAGIVVSVCALLLFLRRRGAYAWLALLASMVVGAIAFADYRGVNDLAREMEVSGRVSPGIGLTLVATAGVIGLVAAVTGIAATPHQQPSA